MGNYQVRFLEGKAPERGLTYSICLLNGGKLQNINKNRKSMNKEYYVSEVEDKSSVEYSKKRSA